MGKNIFANGREISAKADDNKSLAAMPDICLSPPSPPAGPVPIPYPNFSDASKTSSGSKKVKIGGKEVGLKNKSVYKSSKGDEAATRSFGAGVVTHTLSGATKHAAWSFDVKVEGQNVIRFLDLTTHNHSSDPPNIALTLSQAKFNIAIPQQMKCEQLDQDIQETKKNVQTPAAQNGEVNVTTTSASFTHEGSSTRMRAITPAERGITINQNMTEGQRNKAGLSPGRPSTEMQKPCGRGKHSMDSRQHTESKLINQIFAKAKELGHETTKSGGGGALGTLRMSINYQGDQGGQNWVCPHCKAAICGAIDCGLNIELCEDGKLVTTKEIQERCDTNVGWPR